MAAESQARRLRRANLSLLVAIAIAVCWCADRQASAFRGTSFVPASRRPQGAGRASQAGRRVVNVDDLEKLDKSRGTVQGLNFDNNPLVNKDQLFKINADGTILREDYPGGRDFVSIFWAIVVPCVCLGFLVVSISVFLDYDIIDATPVTASLFWFLRKNPAMQPWPQGAAMGFYGFLGSFVLGPFQLFMVLTNKGEGCAEFNKKNGLVTIIRDGEVKEQYEMDDIEKVKFEFSAGLLLFGNREISCIMSNGEEINFQDVSADPTKATLEAKALQLCRFLNVDMEVNETY